MVNTTTGADQRSPDIAVLEGGGFVVTWKSSVGGGFNVYGQRYDADGAPLGAEFLVTDDVSGDRQSVAALDDGGFVVVWEPKLGLDGSGFSIYGQRFDAGGEAVGAKFQVNTTTANNQGDPTLSALDDGGFVVTWTDFSGADGGSAGVFGQRYDAGGATAGAEFQINTFTSNIQIVPAMATLSDGGFVVTWYSLGQDGSGYGVFGQRYDANGDKAGGEFRVNTQTAGDQLRPSVAAFETGGFVVVFASANQDGSGFGIFAQRYDGTGDALGAEFQVNTHTTNNQNSPDVTALADGGFLVSWDSEAQDGDSRGIFAQRFDAEGNAVGAEFQINAVAAGTQQAVEISALPDGGFLAAWESSGPDAESFDVIAKIYGAAGNDTLIGGAGADTAVFSSEMGNYTISAPAALLTVTDNVGGDGTDTLSGIETLRFADGDIAVTVGNGEFQVNTFTAGDQQGSAVAALSDGGFVVTWESAGQDDSGEGIYGQRYDASGAAVGAEFRVNSSTAGNQQAPAVAANADGGFVVAWQSDSGIYSQRYDAAGDAVGTETQHSASGERPAVALTDAGGLVVTWEAPPDNEDVLGQFVDAAGSVVDFTVNGTLGGRQWFSSVASDADGGFTVAWMSNGGDGSGYGIYAKQYDASGGAVGGEFLVNDQTAGDQQYSSIAALAGGGSAIAWSSTEQGGANVYARLFDAAGNPLAVQFLVNTYTNDYQHSPSVTALADGGFVISWNSDPAGVEANGQDGSFEGVFAQRYDADGNALGGEFQINTEANDKQQSPSLAGLDDGGFIATWQSRGQDGSGDGIYAQRYDAFGEPVGPITLTGDAGDNTINVGEGIALVDGAAGDDTLQGGGGDDTLQGGGGDDTLVGGEGNDTLIGDEPTGEEFVVNSTKADDQKAPDIATLDGGGFVVTWKSTAPEGGGFHVYGQRYDANGDAVGDEFQVTDDVSGDRQSVAALDDGGFVVVWEPKGSLDGSGFSVFGRRFDADGTGGDPFLVNTTTGDNQGDPTISALDDGGFVVTWTDFSGADGSSAGVFGQRYDAGGAKVGGEFQINTFTSNIQIIPAMATLSDGGLVVTWWSLGQDGSGYGIYGQRYDAEGGALGGEFRVNTFTVGDQPASSVAALDGGGFVVAWSSDGQDGSSFGIYAQRYDAEGNAVGGEFRVNTHTSDSQNHPDVTALADGGFIVAWNSDGQDGDGRGVFAQRFDAEGSAVGAEFQINTATAGTQQAVDVSALPDGGFVAAWESEGGDGNGFGVLAKIYGAAGDDTLQGGSGDDTLTGGAGDDLFVLDDGGGDDTITDFLAGAGTEDALDVSDFGFASFAAVQAKASQAGADTLIALDDDDSVTLLGVNLGDLSQDDFLI